MSDFRDHLIRLAYHKPELRPKLLPLLKRSDSYTDKHIPRFFHMVFTIDPERNSEQLKQLSNGVLEGVVGISDSNEIMTRFLKDDRNAVLRMVGRDLEKLNDISRVMYKNPNYLMSEGMRSLKRIWDKTSWQAVEEIMRVFPDLLEKKGRGAVQRLGELLVKHRQNKAAIADKYERTESLKAFVVWLHRTIIEVADAKGQPELAAVARKVTPKDLRPHVEFVVTHVVKGFRAEGEWIVKDGKLKVPEGSRLYVSVATEHMNRYREWVRLGKFELFPFPDLPDELTEGLSDDEAIDVEIDWDMAGRSLLKMDKIFTAIEDHNLDKRYEISYIDEDRFEQARRKSS